MNLWISHSRFTMHPSAVATYYAPSDHSGSGGMLRERIRAVPSWRKGQSRYDTVFIKSKEDARTITTGLVVGRVHQFFMLNFGHSHHPCAIIHDFELVGEGPDEDMGLWIVEPAFSNNQPRFRIISLHDIFRAAHLIPVYDDERIPNEFKHTETLDHFDRFYVNKYIDYHAFETAI